MKRILLKMITSAQGLISSKIIIGSISYMILVIGALVLSFTNPSLPGLSEIFITLIIASAGLLGLTTFENTRKDINNKNEEP